MLNLLDEMPEHRLGDLKIGDHAVFHRAYGDDVSRRAAEPALGFLTDGQHIVRARLNGDHGRFPQDNATSPDIHETVGRAQINSNIVGKQAFKLCEHEFYLLTKRIKSVANPKVKL